MSDSSELDSQDQKILALLQENGRLTFTEIGRRVHLTSPAVAERIKRLEESGVICGYGARINLRKIGYSFEAFVQITLAGINQLNFRAVDAYGQQTPLRAFPIRWLDFAAYEAAHPRKT